jgi:hypothetical protein
MTTHREHGRAGASWEARQVRAAAREAAAIGGRAGDEGLDPAERPLVEGGEGVSEGFELAEEDLIKAAEDADSVCDLFADGFTPEAERVPAGSFGDADHEASSEVTDGDW